MKKFLKYGLLGLIGLGVLVGGGMWLVPKMIVAGFTPDHSFADEDIAPAPDYSDPKSWAAWPGMNGPAQRVPAGVAKVPENDRPADVFFLYPTTDYGGETWLAPIDRVSTNNVTDLAVMSGQASAFNGCCQIYAPRYRQGTLATYMNSDFETASKILTIAYEDTRDAFRHYLSISDPDRPLILASHSQGSSHLIRLLQEEVEGKPVQERIVAIYAIGIGAPQGLIDEGLDTIPVCSNPTETGCFITWDAFEEDATPGGPDNDLKAWNGTDYSGFENSDSICVNPLTWTGADDGFGGFDMDMGDMGMGDSDMGDMGIDMSMGSGDGPMEATKADHLGAIPSNFSLDDAGDEPHGLTGDDPLPALITNHLTAKCEMVVGMNMLKVSGDRDASLVPGFPMNLGGNLHVLDYGLFWANIRQNATDRVNAFIANR